ncbi:MAG: Fe-S-containing hydro-lyase [candidate division WOR-3 bacterium]|nr:Fe-S-containing hydro-lyase [candidate division WOR-3 bacterium]MCX7837496.1 Fe-S-containing hydro-lyase [candidate division WOR-3 bacterium]MDW8113397.1 Fe-S-containing hydro-lyase [candidate division WOR-3 bacterium]
MEIKRVTTPLTDEVVESLKAGDQVLISGVIYSARDLAHKRLVEAIEKNEKLPFELKGAVIYYVGPAPAKPGYPIGPAGPTTAGRMDPYTPILLANGLKGMIGKGNRSEEVKRAIMKYKGVYFGAIGGVAALTMKKIKSAKIIAYDDLGPEAISELVVEDFPVIVINDIYGNDLYEIGVKKYAKI